MAFHQKGMLSDAKKIYEDILKQQPNHFDALHLLGVIAGQTKNLHQAEELIGKAIKINPNDAAAYSNRGNALKDLKRVDEALASYDKAIALKPDYAEAYNNRGIALRDLKRVDDALASYDKAVALKPDYAEAYNNRGNVLQGTNRVDDALASYDKAIALKPDYAEAYHNRGNALQRLKRVDDALASYDKAIALKPDYAEAWLGRGNCLQMLKQVEEAILAYRGALKLGADPVTTKYYLAAVGAESPPTASPEPYIANLFDAYADNFDDHLIDSLKYQSPAFLANLIERFVSSNSLDILDLGCGTGLMGKRLRPFGRTLTGVDLSANMLDKARQRKIYDHLYCNELIRFLQTQGRIFDLIVAADVFVYFGDLSSAFREVRRVLSDGGLFCFSVEATDESDFVLRITRRYAHSIGYLQKLAEQCRFTVEAIESQMIRRGDAADINGYHAIMRCL